MIAPCSVLLLHPQQPPAGDYYEVDLLKPPFSVSKPLEIIDENTPDGKHMLLFEVANLTWSDPLQGLA